MTLVRLNKLIANSTGLSRRAADAVISEGRVQVNNQTAEVGQEVNDGDVVRLDGNELESNTSKLTVMLNKPTGYVVSRDGQGSRTIYDLLPVHLHHLKPIGRLDKDSSGLLLLTNDGDLAQKLTHPKFEKQKVYDIELNKPLEPNDEQKIKTGVELEDGVSALRLQGKGARWLVIMHEGRNRQIRRTFEKLGYKVVKLHRIQLGEYNLQMLGLGKFVEL